MENRIILLKIITPEGLYLEDEINNIYLPGELGKTGILKDHLPMILKLACGILKYEDSNKNYHSFFIKKGFLKIENNIINILTEIIIKKEDLNSGEVDEKLSEINQKISGASSGLIKPDELNRLLNERKEWFEKKKLAMGYNKR